MDTRFNDTDNAYVHEFSYVEPGNEGDINGGVQFEHEDPLKSEYVYLHEKRAYYEWVRNWLYSEENNYENSPCPPPYN